MQLWLSDTLIVLVGLLVAGLLTSVETALVGVSHAQVRAALQRHERGARRLLHLLDAPMPVMGALVVLRFVGLGAAAVGGWRLTATIDDLGLTSAPWIGVAVVAVIALVLVHLLPRALARRSPLSWARRTAWLARGVAVVLTPVVVPLVALVGAVVRRAGVLTPGRKGLGGGGPLIQKTSEDLMSSLIEFADTVCREIMVPRTEMVAVSVASSPEEVRQTVLEGGHSRVPVYEDTVDNIIGVLHLKQMVASAVGPHTQPERFELAGLVRPTFYVPEVMKISELLREFQRRKTHMAIVVDEYGGTAGLVTLEDVIEEIVGEIQDEYDVEEKQFRRLSDTKVLADGRVSVWDLEDVLDVRFPEDGDYETLAGFVVDRAGYLPPSGSVFVWNSLRFTVKEADERRIATVEIERLEDGQPAA